MRFFHTMWTDGSGKRFALPGIAPIREDSMTPEALEQALKRGSLVEVVIPAYDDPQDKKYT